MNTETKLLKNQKAFEEKCSCHLDEENKTITVCPGCKELFSYLKDFKPHGYQIL